MKTLLIAATLFLAGGGLAQAAAQTPAQTPDQTPDQTPVAAQPAGAPLAQGATTAGSKTLYPMCSSHVHDSCQQRSQATRMAAAPMKSRHAHTASDQTAAPGV
jgi:hypothetical protein